MARRFGGSLPSHPLLRRAYGGQAGPRSQGEVEPYPVANNRIATLAESMAAILPLREGEGAGEGEQNIRANTSETMPCGQASTPLVEGYSAYQAMTRKYAGPLVFALEMVQLLIAALAG